MLAWYHDIEQLVQLPHMSTSQRQNFIARHALDLLDRQRRSGASSPGLDEDEADEVPYSQTNSSEEATPQSPIRPPPGGSFPSGTRLDDVSLYNRHSRAESDVTSEFQPLRSSRGEDIGEAFRLNDLDRPFTRGTEKSVGSIHDDQEFSKDRNSESPPFMGVTGEGIESKSPVYNYNPPDELNQPTAASASPTPEPILAVHPSKTKREMEETIPFPIGNHSQHDLAPGAWPETPAQELSSREGLFM